MGVLIVRIMTRSKKRYTYDYPRPSVTVDIVLITREAQPRVLLIRRKHDPFAGMWAIPGGFVDMEESLESAARRELAEETGVEIKHLEQLAAFGEPDRDPRGRTISIVFLGRVNSDRLKPQAQDDAAAVGWHSLHRLPPLAFDHAQILRSARERLRRQAGRTGKRRRKPSAGK
jgi:8-oxo-dGTP diphosphatase